MDGSWLFTPILWWHYILMVAVTSGLSLFFRRIALWAKEQDK